MSTDNTSEDDSDGHECPTCGDTFERDTAMKSHHRHVHGEKIGGVTVTCENCGVEMKRSPSEVTEDGVNACSYTCQQRALGHGSRSEYECDHCGETFVRLDASVGGEHQFCDEDCYRSWSSKNIRGEDHPLYGSGEAFDTECSYCGSSIRKTADRSDHEHHFCNDTCRGSWMSENQTGQNHPNWRGGKHIIDSLRKQLRPSFNSIKDDVREEACYSCGESDTRLDVHHIIPLSAGGTNESWNLMTLCDSCHRTAEAHTRKLPGMGAVLIE
jgi:5-methylcytosine-specific restriction endonuclease McrA